ncbi:MAG: glycosyltransferase family 9 protein [Bacteroidia bacterium]
MIIKLDEIGDMVTSLHVFHSLHEQYPNAQIDLYCKPVNRILFNHLPYVLCIDDLESKKYDLIVDLRGNYKSLAFAWKNRPAKRVDRGTVRMRNKFTGGQKNELDTNFEIIQDLISTVTKKPNAITTDLEEKSRVDQWLNQIGINNYVVMHIGAREEIRRWPIKRFQAIIKYLHKHNKEVVLAGGPDDRDLNVSCMSGLNSGVFNAAGVFNLLEFSELCSRADLFIGNESGPLHIAAANRIPIIALFGPGVHKVFYPIGNQVRIHHYFLPNKHKKQNMSNSTINKITVEEVIDSINQLLHLKDEEVV